MSLYLLHEINKFQKELNNLDVKRKIQIETIFQDADLTDEERNKLLKEKEEKETKQWIELIKKYKKQRKIETTHRLRIILP